MIWYGMVWYGMQTEWEHNGKGRIWYVSGVIIFPPFSSSSRRFKDLHLHMRVSVLSILYVFVEKDMVGEGSDHAGQREGGGRERERERGYEEIDG
jgi:hypothetical protein